MARFPRIGYGQAVQAQSGLITRELSTLGRLAAPMILAQVTQMGMGVADTIMAGQVSAVDLAGVALGGNLYWPFILLLSGVIMSLTPSVSQLHGAGRQAEAGEVARQAIWVAGAGGLLLVLFLNNVEPVYRLLEVDERAIPISVAYLEALSFGVLPVLGYFSLRYLCEGMSWTVPAMWIAAGSLALKIPLNFLFIYGGFGIEAMGGVGCGWASVIVLNGQFLVMALVVSRSRIRATGVFSRFSRPDPVEILRLVKLGLPIGITNFMEISLFSVITLLIGRLGAESVAAHMIASNVGGMTFMVPLALGMAVSIRVGFNVGAGDLTAARRSGWVAIWLSLLFALVAAVIVYLFRYQIAGLYSSELAVVAVAADLLIFVALYQFFDDAQVTAVGALRGFKDTRATMWVAMLSYWGVGLPVGVAIGFGWIEVAGFEGVRGFWIGLIAGLGVAAVVLTTRFRWLSHRPDHVAQFATR
jgi:MATE family multidrug resistance protein